MGVDFSIVAVLDTEAEMDTPTLEHVVTEADVPRCHLENMQQVLGYILVLDRLVHDVTQGAHLILAILGVSFHETFSFKDALIEEAFIARQLLEALGDIVVPVTHYEDQEVVLLNRVPLWV